MAVLALFTGKISKAQYETIRKEIKWETDHPAGGICHVATFDEQGHIHVADVWESEDALNAFVIQRLAPVFAKLGVPPPNVAVFPVHNMNVYKASDQYRVP